MQLLKILLLIALLMTPALAQNSLREGDLSPQFAAPGIKDSFFDLSAMRDSVVLLTFWSTKCEICRSEIPQLNRFKKRFEGRPVEFIAVTMEDESRVEPFLRSNKFDFSIIPNGFGIVLQYADRDRQGRVDMGFPAYYLIDRSGKVAYRSSGWDKVSTMESKIDQLLASN
ncbi:MAG TPA: TlpA disulfide reductase family protein [Pyrinomonadaceae bacterium]|nr:TlpA family protein disulfide reductase [Chloracidobacterium sp.]MBP9935031.1 TlpA family protein disulfide reductase [Pyrinomonadaceae bacterium]MBK7801342.1 TlpA family protein disulfide reductase [Chloracidobacterium sp.]MBK9436664.1 TlpA family protein disulfide reductase [Chloracidobacterium sp.]MBL0241652.1 TlpA family protein disulfide reductase [Chloracidobacterium sp.]